MTCDDVAGADPDLGLVVALPDGAGQLLAEARLQAAPNARSTLRLPRDGRADRPLRPVAAAILDQLLELHHPEDEALRAGAGSPGT